MTDEQFFNELWIGCYKAQIDGYPLGHPARTNFQPIVPYAKNVDGTINRLNTLTLPSMCSFTDEEKRQLMVGAVDQNIPRVSGVAR